MKLLYYQYDAKQVNEKIRIVKDWQEDKRYISFNFLDEPQNKVYLTYDLKNEVLIVQKKGLINYKIVHQKNQKEQKSLINITNNKIYVNIKTVDLKISSQKNNKIEIIKFEVKYYLDNQLMHNVYEVERKA